jgi:hypothetical protein
MKYVKMLGLAVIAAMALAAFLGAGSASASVLCENTPAAGTDCTNPVKLNTVIDFSLEKGTSALLKGPFNEVIATCTESTVKGKLEAQGSTSETVKAKTEALTFTSCNHPITVTALGTIEVHHITGSDAGTVTDTGTTVVIHEVPLFGSCEYSTNATDIGKLTGRSETGAAPTFDIGASIKSENGCPTGTWSGSYEYTGTTTFDVAAG